MTTTTLMLQIVILAVVLTGFYLIIIYLRRTRSIIRQLHIEQRRHIWATAAVQGYITSGNVPIPESDGWALSSSTLAYIIRKILEVKPKTIVELGSGVSTVVIGHVAKRIGASLTSIESDQDYFSKTMTLISANELDSTVNLVHAPLCHIEDGSIWYDRQAMPEISIIDMLIVDGPPRSTCRNVRYPALNAFVSQLSPNAIVFLDDTDREDERHILRTWLKEFDDLSVEMLDVPHGGAFITNASSQRWTRKSGAPE